MLKKIRLVNLLFLDIETVPQYVNFKQVPKTTQQLWAEKSKYQRGETLTPEAFYEKAGIWAEFGKIICISVGYFASDQAKRSFRVTTYYGGEKELLMAFKNLLETHFYKPYHLLCAHNGKEFDFPYIARRMLIHQIELPEKLQLFGKKPWEITHLDTLELWKFGDYKHYTSLKLLTHVLGIPTPKDDIDGSDVREVYYVQKDLDRIISYCEKDTVAVAQLVLRFRQESLLQHHEILSI